MFRVIFIPILIFILSGCSGAQPPVTEYRIDSKISNSALDSKGCLDVSLKVAQAFSPSKLISQDMSYALGDHKQFTYSQSQWADSPNRAITSEIVKLLRETELFKSIQISKSRSKNDWILETNIEEFMQYFNEDSTSSYSSVSISMNIIDSRTNYVIATKSFRSRIETKTLDAFGGVKALNNALRDVLQQSAEWFEGVCK